MKIKTFQKIKGKVVKILDNLIILDVHKIAKIVVKKWQIKQMENKNLIDYFSLNESLYVVPMAIK